MSITDLEALERLIAPLKLLPPDPPYSHWTLMLSDADSPADVFEDEGHSGNGYSWDSVARACWGELTEAEHALLEFDSEAGMFVVLCEDEDLMARLAPSLARLLHDHDALRDVIRSVPEDDWDD